MRSAGRPVIDADVMSSGWFFLKAGAPAGQQVGPFTWQQLVAAAQTGALAPVDVVWHQSLPAWLPASQIQGLFPYQWPAAMAPPPRRRRSRLTWVIPLVALVLVGAGLGLGFGLKGESGGDRPGPGPATDNTTTTDSTGPTDDTLPPVVGESGTWLVMMYEDADDEILEEDMMFDVNEAELVGSTDQVTMVAQVDRYAGGYAGDGDWTSTKRFLLSQDSDLYTINSQELADLGELDMGDGATLQEFATWAIQTYPAEHYVLILSNHGGGWTGGWSDSDPVVESGLTMQEIDDALGATLAATGIGAFELVGFDACLMSQLEVMSAITPHARYAVASEETEPLLGWGYAGFLGALTANTAMTGRELGQAIVDSYIAQDIRVTDDGARAILTGGDFTAQSVAAELSKATTMTAVDLGAIKDLNAAVNQLAVALAGIDQAPVAEARAYTQSYESVFGDGSQPSYIDLGHFLDLILAGVGDPAVIQAIDQVKSALAQAVVGEVHGDERAGSSGISIYFPNSELYTGTYDGTIINYPSSIGRFAAASLWDDYLTFHYTGEPFDPASADLAVLTPAEGGQTDFSLAVLESAPSDKAQIVGPGSGGLTIAPITVSATQIKPDEKVTLSTQITGANVAYVYYYVAYYVDSDGSYLSADAGFVEPGSIKEISGVYYPDWGSGDAINVDYEWDPTLFFMSDGNEANDQFAFFSPTIYGADVSTDVYTVRGTYTFADTGTQVDAEMDFSGDGNMQSVWGFTDTGDGTGTWHELSPTPGDTFNITDEYLEFDQNPDGKYVDYTGGTMTFGDTPFKMVPYYTYPGDYTLGIGVEDLDGNVTWEYANVTVAE
jgi:hypothetical protein